jgi:hypothetical protein
MIFLFYRMATHSGAIPVTIVALISILSFLIGKAPETTEPKSR